MIDIIVQSFMWLIFVTGFIVFVLAVSECILKVHSFIKSYLFNADLANQSNESLENLKDDIHNCKVDIKDIVKVLVKDDITYMPYVKKDITNIINRLTLLENKVFLTKVDEIVEKDSSIDKE